MTEIKVVQNFANLWTSFLYFDKISRMWLLQLKNNILIIFIMYIKNHAFLALEPPKIKILQKHFTGIIFSPIEMI